MIDQHQMQYNLMFPMEMKCHDTIQSLTIPPSSLSVSGTSTTTIPLSSLQSTIDPSPSVHTNQQIPSGPMAARCGTCCRPICDRYIMRIVDMYYHEDCLQCSMCSIRLLNSCFQRNGKLYCRYDYERLYLKNRCLGCGDKICSEELVMRTCENVFHLKCFSCVVCGIQLQKGEQYVIKQSQLFCRSDYEKEVEMLQGFNDEYYAEDLFSSKVDGRRGPKRPRTILNTLQRRAFKASFDISPKPCRKVRENLAKETGLSLRIVQVWFQNQRAKVKKIQKKARQDNKSGSETESLGDQSMDNAKIKDEIESDTESYVNGNLESDRKMVVKEEMLGGNDENFHKALNLCTSHFPYKDDSQSSKINTIMGLTYSAFQQLMSNNGPPPVLNPIDRLYSMQNDYFRCDRDDGKFHDESEN